MAEADVERINMACFQLSRDVGGLRWSVPEAAPVARTLLRVVGRVIIDAGTPSADPTVWENTQVTALQWIREAIKPLGYDVRPLPGSGRPEVPEPSSEWA